MDRLEFPTGPNDAIVAAQWTLSFDDLHRLRDIIHWQLGTRLKSPAVRILGCLEDDEKALLALLFLTELTDYMPINPALSDPETLRLVQESGADVAVVSARIFEEKGHLLLMSNVLIWDDIVAAAFEALDNGSYFSSDSGLGKTGRLILHTSGSTGLPKRVPITLDAINASAKNIAKGHDLTAADHALNALPTFHIGALVDVMLAPFVGKGKVSITNKRAPEDLVQALIEHRPTWFQVVPTILRRLVEDLDPALIREAGRSLRFIRSISAPVPPDLKQDVERLFGCPVIEMYGMTETAGQIATNALDPVACRQGSVGKPVGVDVALLDRFGNIVAQGQTGEICVSGPIVFGGYEGTTKDDVFFENWFRTGDLGLFDEDGYLFLRGRLKEMINVGGEKVSPHEIETAVLRMPDVIEAAAYAVAHPTLGEQVGLTIATRVALKSDEAKAFLETQLAVFKCPNNITVVNQLPRLANAKVDRVLLKRTAVLDRADRLAVNQSVASASLSPEAAAVGVHWVRVLKCRRPEGDDDFFDMGGDSLSATQLLLSLEKALDREISPNQLFETPTFSGLVACIQNETETPAAHLPRPIKFVQQRTAGWPGQVAVPDGLLRSIGSLKPGHPLFWASQADYEVQAIRATLGKRRPLYVTGSLRRFKRRTERDFEILGQELAREISVLQPVGPIALGGFCGGAWVMHHAAEALIKMGREIRVFLSFDYWPTRETPFATVHCMSRCEINSARINYARHDLAQGLLHGAGIITLDVDSKHRFEVEDVSPHDVILNGILDGKPLDSDAPHMDDTHWGLEQRLRPPSAKIKVRGRPWVYRAGAKRRFEVEVLNTSSQVWGPTETTGLSLQVDLINLDGHMRKANFAFGAFEHPISPDEAVKFTFDVTFPDKKVPLWLSCNLVSQGLMRFKSRSAGGHKTLVLPRIF